LPLNRFALTGSRGRDAAVRGDAAAGADLIVLDGLPARLFLIVFPMMIGAELYRVDPSPFA
jgi:hypothetical protein